MRNRAGRETRDRILAATRRLLAERGLDGVTVKAICDAAGIRAGSFYNLFDSKEQVVLSVIAEAIAAVDPDPDHTGSETVADLVDAYIQVVEDREPIARLYLTVAVAGGLTDRGIGARVLRHHQERVGRFASAIRRDDPSLDDAEAGVRSEAMLAALNGYAIHSLLDPSFSFAAHARRLVGTRHQVVT
ncbi:MAG: TetR/AcrR family transcriptional regulator [Acidimicrobiia bacterium]|jgi:AcrR family transcriptional regulator